MRIRLDIEKLNSAGVLDILLRDKSTGTNIHWCTDAYSHLGEEYQPDHEITSALITGKNIELIKTRAEKAMDQQSARTRRKAEVFTPGWVCKKMNDFLDEDWFGRADTFKADRIEFSEKRSWKKYVDSRRLEITCGEAPFLVSRYDATTGETIPVQDRIGILDRKLRVVKENATSEEELVDWAKRALQATYGYEYQGDNLLIARINLLMTWLEFVWNELSWEPDAKELASVINVICWNVWQMDGLNNTVPVGALVSDEPVQYTILGWDDLPVENIVAALPEDAIYCRVRNWRHWDKLYFHSCSKGVKRMKFDYVIGNPPYQEEIENNGRKPPVYHLFMDETYKIADRVELITPARFLFNAGQTPKAWNNIMLNDSHLKVIQYEPNGEKIFPNTDIKGGIAITYHDTHRDFNTIGVFTAFPALNCILSKVKPTIDRTLTDITVGAVPYRYTEKLKEDFPGIEKVTGKSFDLRTNAFDKLDGKIFWEQRPDDGQDYVQIFGLKDKKRAYRWILKDYISVPSNFDKWKIFIPEANGSGALGEVLSTPLIGQPLIGHTQTFISMGEYSSKKEAEAILNYVKTKFCRVLLGVLKVTQHNPRGVWRYVPLQDFTPSSDIDWTASVAEIDQQLYKKYGLDETEIEFIESHVKEMK